MMNNLDLIKEKMITLGWDNFKKGNYYQFNFDLMCHRKDKIVDWLVFFKEIDVLDEDEIEKWKTNFMILSEKLQSHWAGTFFIMCLIPEVIKTNQSLSFSNISYGFMKLKTGGGIFLVANKNRIDAKIPQKNIFFNDPYNFTKQIVEMFKEIY